MSDIPPRPSSRPHRFAFVAAGLLACNATVEGGDGTAGGGVGAGPACNSCSEPSCELVHLASASNHAESLIDVGSVVADDEGGAVVVGDLWETIDLGTGPIDAGMFGGYIAAFDGAGVARWALAYPDVRPTAITRMPSGTFVIAVSSACRRTSGAAASPARCS